MLINVCEVWPVRSEERPYQKSYAVQYLYKYIHCMFSVQYSSSVKTCHVKNTHFSFFILFRIFIYLFILIIIIIIFLLCYHKCRQLGLQPIFKHIHFSTHISHYCTKKINARINKICSNSIYYECPNS